MRFCLRTAPVIWVIMVVLVWAIQEVVCFAQSITDTNLCYMVDQFEVSYGPRDQLPHPQLPPAEELLHITIPLSQRDGYYDEPGGGGNPVIVTLSDDHISGRFSARALSSISRALTRFLTDKGLLGVWASPDAEDINEDGKDIREGRKDLRFLVHVGEVREVRTIAKGKRFPPNESITNSAHARILESSPLKAPAGEGRGSLLNRQALDPYIGRLNRFPSRTVETAVSSSGEPNGVVLDYLIAEDKPWVVYFQAANTGTESTGEWRERFGFINQQFTSRDDILSLDFITSSFDTSYVFFGSYELPVIYPNLLRLKTYGSWGTFTAEELGIPSFGNLLSDIAVAGAEAVWSPMSFSSTSLGRLELAPLYLDFTFGLKWKGEQTENQLLGTLAATDLVLPYFGINFSSLSQRAKLAGGVQIEGNLADVANTDASPFLGRLNTDSSWIVLKWGGGFSFFIDPLMSPTASMLVNEFSFSARGQYTLDNRRLIPSEMELIGGFYSVRGYPEAFASGDTAYVGSAEYRLYIARVLSPPKEMNVAIGSKVSSPSQFGNPLRFRPKETYGRPDWDLIFRVFLDGGQSFQNRPTPFEIDANLLGCGVGLELQLRRNLNLRLDYGIPLISQEDATDPVTAGDGRFNFSATLAY